MGTGGDQLATCDRAKSLVAERRMVGWLRRVVFSLFGPCRRIEESGVDNIILSLVRAVLSSELGRSHTIPVKVNARVTVDR